MVNVLIIGCGGIAGFPSHTGSETESRRGVIWIFDGTPGRAAQKAAEFGGKAFDTLDEALADPGIDAAVICTPHVHTVTWLSGHLRRANTSYVKNRWQSVPMTRENDCRI